MDKKQFNQNIEYLNKCDVNVSNEPLWEGYKYSRELSKEGVLNALNNFDINEEVKLWSNNLSKTPFNNIKELYEDIEEWVSELQEIASNMPY